MNTALYTTLIGFAPHVVLWVVVAIFIYVFLDYLNTIGIFKALKEAIKIAFGIKNKEMEVRKMVFGRKKKEIELPIRVDTLDVGTEMSQGQGGQFNPQQRQPIPQSMPYYESPPYPPQMQPQRPPVQPPQPIQPTQPQIDEDVDRAIQFIRKFLPYVDSMETAINLARISLELKHYEE